MITSRPQAIAVAGALALAVTVLKSKDAIPAMVDAIGDDPEARADMLGAVGILFGLPRDQPMNQIDWHQSKPAVTVDHLKRVLLAINEEWEVA